MTQLATQPACIRHTELPGTSRLFADFTYHFQHVAKFYRHNPHDPASYGRAAAEIQYPGDRRAALVDALRAQNGDSESLRRLAEPGTVAVVTGQQVGLFGGPAYTIFKAATAARLARKLTDDGIPAVPVFWLATEDHDFAEVNHAWVYDAHGESQMVKVDAPAALAGRQHPVGAMAVAAPPIDELRRVLAGLPFADDVVALVAETYRPGVSMGEAFRALLQKLCGHLGLLLLDPLDPAIRKIGAPFIVDALKAAPELKASLLERNKELTAAGYHAQVHIEPKTSLFFLLENGERVGLRRKDADYAALADRAADISPNAVLRPVMQDYLLPTVAYVGGPGELAYFAQSHVIYERLLGRMPVMLARAGFTLMDQRSAKTLARFGLMTTDTFVRPEVLKDQISCKLVPASLVQTMEQTASNVTRQIAGLKDELLRFDPTLAAALEKSEAKIAYQMGKMRGKTEREAIRRDERAAADARHLSSMLFPHRHLQERFYSILPFLAQHGLELTERLTDAIVLDCPDHQVFAI
ncbi:MAG: bacillithiol biosynthesis cysteine-adding enzyme BshC [Bryobacteraceae bacterium]